MADDKRHSAGATALAISVPTAIALVYSFLKGQKVEAGPNGEYVLPEEVIELLVAMAATSEETRIAVQAILARLAEGGGGQGWPPNTKYVRSSGITCVAANTAYEAPNMIVPSGMALIVKSHPINAPGTLIQVATTPADCLNPNSSYPLLPSEAVSYHVQNAEVLRVSSTAAGSIVVFSSEQEV